MTQTSSTETYAEKRSRIEAENDAFRKRGSKLARKLLALQLACEGAQRPTDVKTTSAALRGATQVLAAMHGWTETAWHLAVLAPFQAAKGDRPAMGHGLGGNQAYLAWEASLAEAIDAEITKLVAR